MKKDYLNIAEHYELKLKEHGPGHAGMDWPNEEDLATRFEVMMDLVSYNEYTGSRREEALATKTKSERYSRKNFQAQNKKIHLLDLGCGSGLLVDHLKKTNQLYKYNYHGVDISNEMIKVAKERLPSHKFEVRDILKQPLESQSYDFVIMNGVMTEKVSLGYDDMVRFATSMISAAFSSCSKGIAFNVMSTHVDWKRDDLFHWPHDEAAAFLRNNCSRHFVFRNDYGLYEYTTYVLR